MSQERCENVCEEESGDFSGLTIDASPEIRESQLTLSNIQARESSLSDTYRTTKQQRLRQSQKETAKIKVPVSVFFESLDMVIRSF